NRSCRLPLNLPSPIRNLQLPGGSASECVAFSGTPPWTPFGSGPGFSGRPSACPWPGWGRFMSSWTSLFGEWRWDPLTVMLTTGLSRRVGGTDPGTLPDPAGVLRGHGAFGGHAQSCPGRAQGPVAGGANAGAGADRLPAADCAGAGAAAGGAGAE